MARCTREHKPSKKVAQMAARKELIDAALSVSVCRLLKLETYTEREAEQRLVEAAKTYAAIKPKRRS